MSIRPLFGNFTEVSFAIYEYITNSLSIVTLQKRIRNSITKMQTWKNTFCTTPELEPLAILLCETFAYLASYAENNFEGAQQLAAKVLELQEAFINPDIPLESVRKLAVPHIVGIWKKHWAMVKEEKDGKKAEIHKAYARDLLQFSLDWVHIEMQQMKDAGQDVSEIVTVAEHQDIVAEPLIFQVTQVSARVVPEASTIKSTQVVSTGTEFKIIFTMDSGAWCFTFTAGSNTLRIDNTERDIEWLTSSLDEMVKHFHKELFKMSALSFLVQFEFIILLLFFIVRQLCLSQGEQIAASFLAKHYKEIHEIMKLLQEYVILTPDSMLMTGVYLDLTKLHMLCDDLLEPSDGTDAYARVAEFHEQLCTSVIVILKMKDLREQLIKEGKLDILTKHFQAKSPESILLDCRYHDDKVIASVKSSTSFANNFKLTISTKSLKVVYGGKEIPRDELERFLRDRIKECHERLTSKINIVVALNNLPLIVLSYLVLMELRQGDQTLEQELRATLSEIFSHMANQEDKQVYYSLLFSVARQVDSIMSKSDSLFSRAVRLTAPTSARLKKYQKTKNVKQSEISMLELSAEKIEMELVNETSIMIWMRMSSSTAECYEIQLGQSDLTIHAVDRHHRTRLSSDEARNLASTINQTFFRSQKFLTLQECAMFAAFDLFLYNVHSDLVLSLEILSALERVTGKRILEYLHRIRLTIVQGDCNLVNLYVPLLKQGLHSANSWRSYVRSEFVEDRIKYFKSGQKWSESFAVVVERGGTEIGIKSSDSTIQRYHLKFSQDSVNLEDATTATELNITEILELLKRILRTLRTLDDVGVELILGCLRLLICLQMCFYSGNYSVEEDRNMQQLTNYFLKLGDTIIERSSHPRYVIVKTMVEESLRQIREDPSKRTERFIIVSTESYMNTMTVSSQTITQRAQELTPEDERQSIYHLVTYEPSTEPTPEEPEKVDPQEFIFEDVVCVTTAHGTGYSGILPPCRHLPASDDELAVPEKELEEPQPLPDKKDILTWGIQIGFGEELEMLFYVCDQQMYVLSCSGIELTRRLPEEELDFKKIEELVVRLRAFIEGQQMLSSENISNLICCLSYLTRAADAQGKCIRVLVHNVLTFVFTEFEVRDIPPQTISGIIFVKDSVENNVYKCENLQTLMPHRSYIRRRAAPVAKPRKYTTQNVTTKTIFSYNYGGAQLMWSEENDTIELLTPSTYSPMGVPATIELFWETLERLTPRAVTYLRTAILMMLAHILLALKCAGEDISALQIDLEKRWASRPELLKIVLKIFEFLQVKLTLKMLLAQVETYSNNYGQEELPKAMLTLRTTQTLDVPQARPRSTQTKEEATSVYYPVYECNNQTFCFIIYEAKISMIRQYIASGSAEYHLSIALNKQEIEEKLMVAENFALATVGMEDAAPFNYMLIITVLIMRVLLEVDSTFNWNAVWSRIKSKISQQTPPTNRARFERFSKDIQHWMVELAVPLYEILCKEEKFSPESEPAAAKPARTRKPVFKKTDQFYFVDDQDKKITLKILDGNLYEGDSKLEFANVMFYTSMLIIRLETKFISLSRQDILYNLIALYILLCVAEGIQQGSSEDILFRLKRLNNTLSHTPSDSTTDFAAIVQYLFKHVRLYHNLRPEERTAVLQQADKELADLTKRQPAAKPQRTRTHQPWQKATEKTPTAEPQPEEEAELFLPKYHHDQITRAQKNMQTLAPKVAQVIPLKFGSETLVRFFLPGRNGMLSLIFVADEKHCYAVPVKDDGSFFVQSHKVSVLREKELKTLFIQVLEQVFAKDTQLKMLKLAILALMTFDSPREFVAEHIKTKSTRNALLAYIRAAEAVTFRAMLAVFLR